MLKPDEDRPFFNRERDRLAGEIGIVCVFPNTHPLTPTRLHKQVHKRRFS